MESLKSELSLVLGETVGRLETISEQPPTRLYALYDRQDKPMPVVAKYFRHQGRAALEAKKLALLGHEGLIAVPAVYGLVLSQQPPAHEMLLMARLNGVSAEAPTRDAARWQQLCEEVVEGLLAWHRISGHGLVGTVEQLARLVPAARGSALVHAQLPAAARVHPYRPPGAVSQPRAAGASLSRL